MFIIGMPGETKEEIMKTLNYPFEVDPLFECDHLKDICRDPKELGEKVDRMKKLSNGEYKMEFEKAQAYLNEYFGPIREESLKVFVG